ncbi:MAG: bifunctional nuclease family protein [bacterium]
MIEVRVDGLLVDNTNNSPVVLLRENGADRVLPIYIGPFEASAIAYALQRTDFPRPMTLDLMRLVTESLGGTIRRVIVSRLEQDTFFAQVVIDGPAGVVSVDARPSDSIGLALRADVPIFVAEEVMERAGHVIRAEDEGRLDELRSRLREIEPEDFGNYRM